MSNLPVRLALVGPPGDVAVRDEAMRRVCDLSDIENELSSGQSISTGA